MHLVISGVRRVERTIPGIAATSIVDGGDATQVRHATTAVPLGRFAGTMSKGT